VVLPPAVKRLRRFASPRAGHASAGPGLAPTVQLGGVKGIPPRPRRRRGFALTPVDPPARRPPNPGGPASAIQMVLQSARGPASSSAQGRRRQRRRNAPARGLVALGVDRPDPSVSARDEGRRVPLPFGSSTHPSSARRGHELRRGRRWTGSRETDRNTARSLPPECSRPPPGADRNTGAGGHRLGQPADAHPIGAAGGVVRPRREIGSDAGSTRCRGPAERARRAFGAHVRSGRAGH
jgi:hypothetical protein